jgi:hypothetical protein
MCVSFQGTDRPRELTEGGLSTVDISLIAEESLNLCLIFVARVSFDEINAMPGKKKASAFGFNKDQVFAVSGSWIGTQYIAGGGIRDFVHFSQERIGAGKMNYDSECHAALASVTNLFRRMI